MILLGFFLYCNQLCSTTYQQSLEIAREIGDRQEEAASLNGLGGAFTYLSEYERSISFHQQALEIAREIGDRSSEVTSLNDLGISYRFLGQYERAVDFHQQALEIAREIGSYSDEAHSLENLGISYRSLGQFERAINFHQQALEIVREISNRQREGATLGSLGHVYDSLGQYERAINFYQSYYEIALEIGDRRGQAASLNGLGSAYYSLGQYGPATDYFMRVVDIAQEIGDRQATAASLGNLGNIYFLQSQYERAINSYQRHYEITSEIGDRRGEATSLNSLGIAFSSTGQYEAAIDYLEQALATNLEINNARGEAINLANLGTVYYSSNKFGKAEEVLLQSIEIFESLRTKLSDDLLISIADTQAMAFTNLERSLIAQEKVAKALAMTERGRGRAFLLQFTSRVTSQGEQENLLIDNLIVPTVRDIQQIAFNKDATLVVYSNIFKQSLYVWVVEPSGDIEFRSVDFDGTEDNGITALASIYGPLYRRAEEASELSELVAETRSASINVIGTETEQLKELHQILIDPIADLLPTDPAAKVAFIPQGSLFLVPFAALQDEEGTYLVEKHTILTAPSIQVFGLAHDAAQERPTLSTDDALIVGNPVMPEITVPTDSGELSQVQLASLPGAGEEAKAIAQFLNTQPLTDDEATEARIKQLLPSAGIIHLATHGLLDYGDPQASGVRDLPGAVALAPGDGEDGLLTSAEIYEMSLQANLAVLSACDTGRGRITGDGVVGLSRSLITAGVPSVIVSLWSVPDAPTAELMTEFYRQLEQGQDKAQALRQAILATMAEHPNPRDWAAFTLIGNGL